MLDKRDAKHTVMIREKIELCSFSLKWPIVLSLDLLIVKITFLNIPTVFSIYYHLTFIIHSLSTQCEWTLI